jgi:hypothetical protein
LNSLEKIYVKWLNKAIGHLEYSYKKLKDIKPEVAEMDDEELESWEGLVSRFARAGDIFLSKVLRYWVEAEDPGFRGSFKDLVHTAEKYGLLKNPEVWFRIRELRNLVVHEYAGESANEDLAEMIALVPHILVLRREENS